MTIGENLKILRKENNLTQQALGDLLHVSNKTISKWESNRSIPDIDTIKKIAKLFDIEYKILIDGDVGDVGIVKQHKSMKQSLVLSLYIIFLIVLNYFFGKVFVIYSFHFIFMFIAIIISTGALLAICKTYINRKKLSSLIFLSISSVNLFVLITTIFTSEQLFMELFVILAVYWLFISIISYFIHTKIKSKKIFIFLFIIYILMELLIPIVVLYGIGMSSYGNV
ncbi:MAG: helix-turn-helix domain-containing protein [Candidatus Izimaplasma sp.]|nr:helix-turn-helix domain-containing protein [Candidatus Izimaplasma bacterium]